MVFSPQQNQAINLTERINSVLSLIGCLFVILTFVFSPRFRKPVNRLIFYAIFGNILYIIPGLIALDGIQAGQSSALCQTQAFIIQAALPADALWNLAMALNVYATVFKHYDPSQLRAREPWYHFVNYGVPFIIALAYCFVSTDAKGKVYGDATIWCWITQPWGYLRIVTCYGSAWICMMVSFFIYVYAGREILQKRKQVQSFSGQRAASKSQASEAPSSSFKTTEIHVASELVDHIALQPTGPKDTDSRAISLDQIHSGKGHYSVTIASGPAEDSSLMRLTPASGLYSTESQSAAYRYTKCCILFFLSLLVTWVPSSVNRVRAIVYPTSPASFAFSYAAAFVLPLTGFWNSLVYITTSWSSCKELWKEDIAPALGISAHSAPVLPWASRPIGRSEHVLDRQTARSQRGQKSKSLLSIYDDRTVSPDDSLAILAGSTERNQE